MKTKTVSDYILEYLKKEKQKGTNWIFGGVLERELTYTANAKPSTIARTARELSESNIISKDYFQIGGKGNWYVSYKIKK